MSQPTTPQRSEPVFENSSPLSSRKDATPSQLTPRSKVKALLAGFSHDSEEDTLPQPRKAHQTTEAPPRVLKSTITREAGDTSQASSGGEDVLVAKQPRGRLASRMLVQKEDNIEDADDDSDHAYERVKRQLLGKLDVNATVPKRTEKVGYPNSPIRTFSNSDDGIERAAPPRRKLTKPRGQTASSPSTPKNARRTPPGLFVSPGPVELNTGGSQPLVEGTLGHDEGDSDSDLPENPAANARFMALVERKRQERLARENEEAEKRMLKKAQRRMYAEDQEDEIESGENSVEERLTQQARPTRKASKKALEEMHRETQRMARNMQLAYEARTKKRITKQSLFERFNYKPDQQEGHTKMTEDNSRPQTWGSSSAAASEVEHAKSTPPTSPVSSENPLSKLSSKGEGEDSSGVITTQGHQGSHSPLVLPRPKKSRPFGHEAGGIVVSASEDESAPKLDKGKGRAAEVPDGMPSVTKKSKKAIFAQPPIRVQPPKKFSGDTIDSDSDLEIIHERKPKKYSVFEKAVKQETKNSSSLHALRLLAQLDSPGKQASLNKTMSANPVEMQLDLRRKARQQAVQEREERLQQLRDRGVIVPTAEERARDAEEVEDLVAKSRQEAETIMKRERAAAKKARKESGEVDPLGESSDEDEDWADDEEQAEIDLSGSEDEEESNDGSDVEGEVAKPLRGEEIEDAGAINPLLDDEASEGSDEEKNAEAEDEDMEDVPFPKMRKGRHARVLSDDEDDENTLQSVGALSFQRHALKQVIPGLPVSDAATLRLTQMFASTMDDPETAGTDSQQAQDSLAFLRDVPAPTLPEFDTMGFGDDPEEVIKDSQSYANETKAQMQDPLEREVDLHYSQSQIQYDSIRESFQAPSATQVSDFPDPSQDIGFQKVSPIKNRFATTPSTVSTGARGTGSTVATQIIKSPIVRRGRLRRKVEMQAFSDEEGSGEDANGEDDFEIPANIFDIMKKAAKKSKPAVPDSFDRTKSEAKKMVDEQAEESEDEYAGLGGASGDDESGNEEDAAEMKEMIDDDGNIVVNEREIAAFYADKARASDEKQVEKLFKDIASGALRRKRGADYDLSDSGDGGEARRRRKQREFAKMRKALLKDENIGKIATNPKKQAFLHAIEDRDEGDELDFLENVDDLDQESPDSQDPPDGLTATTGVSVTGVSKRKRDAESDSRINDENRPPPHHRKSKRPSTLAEIRQSLSTLIAEPHNAFDNIINVNDDDDEHSSDNENGDHATIKRRRTINTSVIDRVALKRAESAASISETARLAFHDPAVSVSSPSLGSRVPALLRRATSSNNGIRTNTTTAATERMAGGGEEGSAVKRGGKASSSINFYQREMGRKKVVLEVERERKRALKVQVEGRRKGIAGLFGGGGKFD